MDILIQYGIDWIIAIQALGNWLEAPMKFFTFLGSDNFFYLVLPLIYWSIDASLGLKVGFILITSASLNSMVKLWFAGPRPYWVSEKVIPFTAENTFGVPQGMRRTRSVFGASLHHPSVNPGRGLPHRSSSFLLASRAGTWACISCTMVWLAG